MLRTKYLSTSIIFFAWYILCDDLEDHLWEDSVAFRYFIRKLIEHWYDINIVFFVKANMVEVQVLVPCVNTDIYQYCDFIFDPCCIMHGSNIPTTLKFRGMYFNSEGQWMDFVT